MDGIRALSTLERGSHSTVIMLTYTERKMAANCGLQMCMWNMPIHQLRCPRQARKEANEMAYFYGSESSVFLRLSCGQFKHATVLGKTKTHSSLNVCTQGGQHRLVYKTLRTNGTGL